MDLVLDFRHRRHRLGLLPRLQRGSHQCATNNNGSVDPANRMCQAEPNRVAEYQRHGKMVQASLGKTARKDVQGQPDTQRHLDRHCLHLHTWLSDRSVEHYSHMSALWKVRRDNFRATYSMQHMPSLVKFPERERYSSTVYPVSLPRWFWACLTPQIPTGCWLLDD